MLRGFDVSHHQGAEDWPGMQLAHGISFGFAKGTQREDFRDSRFPENWAAMRVLDARGAYHFAEPDLDPYDDVELFLNYVNPTEPTDLLVLDLERSTLSQEDTSAWAQGWAQRCRSLAPAYVPGIYMGGGYLTNRTGLGLRGPFGWLWYPRYPSSLANRPVWPEFNPPQPLDRLGYTVAWKNTAWGRMPDFWQFSATFPVEGESHDANVFGGTLTQLLDLNKEPPVDINPDQKISLLKPDGKGGMIRNAAGVVLNLDEITLGSAIGLAAAAGHLAPKIANAIAVLSGAVAGVPEAVAAKLAPHPVDLEVLKQAVTEVLTDSGLLGLLPGQ